MHNLRILATSLFILFCLPADAAQLLSRDTETEEVRTSIRMLPPEQSNGAKDTVCKTKEGNKVLTWDGSSSIKCNNTLVIDQTTGDTATSGNLVAGGMVKVGNTEAQCNSAIAGSLRWTGTIMEYCDGTSWMPFGSGISACTVCYGETASIVSEKIDGKTVKSVVSKTSCGMTNAATDAKTVGKAREMLTHTCPDEYPRLLSGACWRKESGTYIGSENEEDGRSYTCRIEGGNGLRTSITCCR